MIIRPKDELTKNFGGWEFFVTEQYGDADDRGFSNILYEQYLDLNEDVRDIVTINIHNMATLMQAARDKLKFPIPIDSAWRSIDLNNKVEGVEDSLHLLGAAVDPKLDAWRLIQFKQFFVDIVKHSGGYGYGHTKAHVDIGYSDPPRRWNY